MDHDAWDAANSHVIILREIVKRLAPEFEGLTQRELRAARAPGDGKGHLFQALSLARRALASGDDTVIHMMALHCPPLEILGRRLAERFRAEAIKAIKRRGGERTGAKQTTAAREKYSPLAERYRALMAGEKMRSGTAIFSVRNEMLRAAERAIETGDPPITVPTTRTLRKWLRGESRKPA